jgi:hypothetical protein
MRDYTPRLWNGSQQLDRSYHEVRGHCGGVMTSAELRAELTRIQHIFNWSLTRNGCIRAELKSDPGLGSFDPIAALVYVRTGKVFAEGCWTAAAEELGLPLSDCADVIVASNFAWDTSCRQGQLRAELLMNLMPQPAQSGRVMSGWSLENLWHGSRKRLATPTH